MRLVSAALLLAALLFAPAAFAQYNVVFVTSTMHTGNMGGLAGADVVCQSRATAAGLSGTFRAWLSSSTTSALSRMGSARGFVRRDGEPVADTLSSLTSSSAMLNVIDRNEMNAQVSTELVWTATNINGTYASSGGSCSDWTNGTTPASVQIGSTRAGPGLWTNAGLGNCATTRPLYCFQIDFNAPLVPSPPTGRLVFLTSTTFVPGGGLAAADAHCALEAQTAGLTGTYQSLLAPTGATAMARWDNSAINYQRPDGVTVGTRTDLGGNTGLRSGIWQLANGTYPATANIAVWTGSTAPGNTAANGDNCNNWTSGSNLNSGATGRAGYVSTGWWDAGPAACDSSFARLYCAQTDTPGGKRPRAQITGD